VWGGVKYDPHSIFVSLTFVRARAVKFSDFSNQIIRKLIEKTFGKTKTKTQAFQIF
jgi:hypothetical protein